MERTFIEFFAGIGLMRMGLERAGWRCLWANDISPDKKAMYEGHFGAGHFHLADVADVDPGRIPTATLATASFPCTNLSVAGDQEGIVEGTESSAFWGFAQAIAGMGGRRPPIILLENVVGFLTSNGGSDLRAVLKQLNQLGYAVDLHLVDAANFVPQSRKRVFVVGMQGEGEEIFPLRTGMTRPDLVAGAIMANHDLEWRLHDVPPPPPLGTSLADIVDPTAADWWPDERAQATFDILSPASRQKADEMMGGAEVGYASLMRRGRDGRLVSELRTDGIVGCMTTPKGGSSQHFLFAAGGGGFRIRNFTPAEFGALFGAVGYTLDGIPDRKATFGFGDAVVVPVIEWLARHLLDPTPK